MSAQIMTQPHPCDVTLRVLLAETVASEKLARSFYLQDTHNDEKRERYHLLKERVYALEMAIKARSAVRAMQEAMTP